MPLMPHISGVRRVFPPNAGNRAACRRISLVPGPCGADDICEIGDGWLPAELALGLGGIADESCRIAAAARSGHDRNLLPRSPACSFNHLTDGEPAAIAEV